MLSKICYEKGEKIAWSASAWFKLTCKDSPPPPLPQAHSRCGFAISFLSWRSIPNPRASRKRKFPSPELQIDVIYVFWVHLLDPYKAKRDVFTTFIKRFPDFFERGIIDVIVKLTNEQYI